MRRAINLLAIHKHNIANAFALFLILNVVPKAWGLNRGNVMYTLFAVFSVIFWRIKCICTDWTAREVIISVVILGIAAISMLTTRRLGIFLSVLTVISMKEMTIDKTLRFVFPILVLTMSIKIFLTGIGIMPMNVIADRRRFLGLMEVQRWDFGYGTANIFHAIFAIAIILFLYVYENKKKRLIVITALTTLNLVVYLFTYSTTGLVMTFFSIIAFEIVHQMEVNNRISERVCWGGCLLCVALVTLFSFVLPVLYVEDGNLEMLNKYFSGRFHLSNMYLNSYPITFWGQQFTLDLPGLIDNAYVFILMQYGIITFLMVVLLYGITLYRLIKLNDLKSVVFICIFMLYGISEQFFVNSFMNYSWLLVGNVIFTEQSNETTELIF